MTYLAPLHKRPQDLDPSRESDCSRFDTPAGGGEEAEEQSEFDVILKAAGDQKIKVIKAVREATGLGLKEAKDLVDGAPKAIKEGLPKDEAEALAEKIKEAGGEVELK